MMVSSCLKSMMVISTDTDFIIQSRGSLLIFQCIIMSAMLAPRFAYWSNRGIVGTVNVVCWFVKPRRRLGYPGCYSVRYNVERLLF